MDNFMNQLVDDQKAFYYSGKTRSVEFRIKMLKKLYYTIRSYEQDIIEALYKDLGKSEHEAITTEIGIALNEIKNTVKMLPKWDKKIKKKTNSFNIGTKSSTIREPYGSTLIIAPWNYPFYLAISPLIGAIAGGNCVVLKPSEISSHTADVLEDMIGAMYNSRYITVVQGGIPETNELLEERFDLIFFTGSPSVGKIIMEKAAKHLTPVILELGGKSPCIIDENINMKQAVKKIVFGKATNAGQTCVAPDYVLIHENQVDEFYKLFKKVVKGFYGKDLENNADYGRIINDNNFDRIVDYLDDGDIIVGGGYNSESRHIDLTLLEIHDLNVPVMNEEIFGPVLPVITFSNLDDIVAIVSRNPDPLAMYIFSEDVEFYDYLLKEIPFGGGCINETIMHITNEHLPFGGRGTSGIGNYHGQYSFEAFTHEKAILQGAAKSSLPLKYPPFKKSRLKMIKKILY